MFIPIQGFAPDADTTEPGVLTDADLLVPTLNGMTSLGQDVDQGITGAGSAPASASTLELLDGTYRTFLGTNGNLYEIVSAAWTNRNKLDSTASATLSYTITANAQWTFAQYGNVSFAATKSNPLQFSDTSGRFADVGGGAPQAVCVASTLDFVMCANTTDATYGDQGDRWWCCAAGDYTSWTADIATQAATGRLQDEPGPIVALKNLGDLVVAYKERAMFAGRYVGPPAIWSWSHVPGTGFGTHSPHAVVNLESAHAFLGQDNFYIYDGTRPTAIGTNRVAAYVLDDLNWQRSNLICGMHDRNNWRIYWWYPSANSAVLDKFVCYNYRSNRWGRGTKTVYFAWEYFSSGVSYDQVGTLYTTYDDIPATGTYDDLFTTTSQPLAAILDSTAVVYTMTGAGSNSYGITGDMGVDDQLMSLTRVRPRFRTPPTTGTQRHYYRDQLGGTERTSTTSTTLSDGAFDHVWAARWHRVRQDYTGNMELLGWDVDLKPESFE